MPELDKDYWNNRWLAGATGWDVGYATPPIVQFMQQVPDKNIAILIPGCGNAYEAAALLNLGFTNLTLIDIAPAAVANLQQLFGNQVTAVCTNFFHYEGSYDLVLEQTFFCALNPSLRKNYVAKMHQLLNTNGKLAGVLFSTRFPDPGPPFGGTKPEYRQLFWSGFKIIHLEACYNSIPQRKGRELFIELIKK
ncbi:methyltransferase domain-containing protein [Niabella ginsenosidivorans]|uniref:methyltransferase domain-containing protein n=1 Tax=Niabella ginsenosidivorans TaxID=1176587 RepID=UPI001FE112AF|nr:methyltransferase domain-containing protein [Niabella ginsenosidivorans]